MLRHTERWKRRRRFQKYAEKEGRTVEDLKADYGDLKYHQGVDEGKIKRRR